jgi:calcineurin-like phosphoesterase family protein
MSNYFPDGRPIQRMMQALSGEAVCIGISSAVSGNIRNAVSADWSLARYPNFATKAAFDEALSKVNLFEIITGGTYSVAGSTNTVTTPVINQFFTSAQNFQTMNVTNSKIVLYIKPTP